MTNKKLMKKIAPVVMSAAVAMTSMPYAVLASDFTDSEVLTDSTDFSVSEEFAAEDAQEEFTTEDVQDAFAAEAQQGEAYVLMNIPYDDFYKAELKNNDVKVDAFTSATLNKSRTAGMMNGNSAYHVDPNGTDVTGVTFPVKVSDLSLLKDQKQVTDSDSVTITVTNKGQTSSNTYTGKDSLIENASYSYYILSETPSYYKELTVNADHESGTLYNMLSHIIYNGLNMTKIESRPITGKNWQYRFFVDFEGNLKDSAVKNALRGIEAEADRMRILGNY